ncbi:ABC transporter substrate-binding protein [Candidatus Lokiarchaeum ossiferum]|uniref:ABC transporter substrate-binding protein n=1 Tax=Candidatus Lokiarchaeum ossiferum TaxID=2951803 RepID=UPI00352C0A48
MDKRKLIGGIIFLVLTFNFGFVTAQEDLSPEDRRPFIYGTLSLASNIDPHFAWDGSSINFIDQICEGLFAYDLESENLDIVPILAANAGIWNENSTEYTVELKREIVFHDGSLFNAQAVKWSFDRLTSILIQGRTPFAELYKPLAEIYPTRPLLLNETRIDSEYEVTFKLNYPYIPFLSLLCFSGSKILSSLSTPINESLQVNSDVLIGTGPFIQQSHTNERTQFKANENYWREVPEIREMFWIKYSDPTSLQQSLIGGDVHMSEILTSDFYDKFESSEEIELSEPIASASISFIAMNNDLISLPLRKAITYAVNYSYIINQIGQGSFMQMTSIVPPSITYHNPNVLAPTMNITHARKLLMDHFTNQSDLLPGETIIDFGVITPTSSDEDWRNFAENTPICDLNYTYNLGSKNREDIGFLLKDNLKSVGIDLQITGVTFEQYFLKITGNFHELELFIAGWGADYNDPSNFINPLLRNTSLSNGARVNDPYLEQLMDAGLLESNSTLRRDIYYEIQDYTSNDLFPWIHLYYGVVRIAHSTWLSNYPINSLGYVYFYPCSWQAPAKTISSFNLLLFFTISLGTIYFIVIRKRK